MFTKILVPLDGSALSERAVSYAQQMAGRNGRLLLVRATMSHRRLGLSEMQAQDDAIGEAESYLANWTERLSRAGVDAEWRVYYGPATEGIREEASIHHVDSIAMSTHGRSGVERLMFGSVAEQALHDSQVPLLLVPARSRTDWTGDGSRRVVVPLDGSEGSEAALEPAVRLASRLGASIYLAAVVEPVNMGYLGYGVYIPGAVEANSSEGDAYLASVAERLRRRGLAVDTKFEIGFAAQTIAELAREESTAAVVMATHGRAGLARLILGSTTTALVRHSMAPLLVVRPLAWQKVAEPAVAPSLATA